MSAAVIEPQPRRTKRTGVKLMASFVVEQRLQEFYGKSGIVYLVNYNVETHWSPFRKTADGWVSLKDNNEARAAAIDCGAVGALPNILPIIFGIN
jgi:hypothetical protein